MSSSKGFLTSQAGHHRELAKHHKILADAHKLLSQAAESHMDIAGGKCHKVISDVHLAISQAHSAHAEQLSTAANSGRDVWPLAGQTVNSHGDSTNEGKADTVAEFWKSFYRTDPPAPKQIRTAELFK